MGKWLHSVGRISFLVVLGVILLFTMPVLVLAAPSDSLVIHTSTDKNVYTTNDVVLCHVTIENPTNVDAKDVELTVKLPDGLVLDGKSHVSFHIGTIAAHTNFEKDLTCKAVKGTSAIDGSSQSKKDYALYNNKTSVGLANLSDNFSLWLVIALVVVGGICVGIALWSKHTHGACALFITVIGASLCLSNVAYAQSNASQKMNVHTTKTITVNDITYDITFDVSYIWETNSPTIAIDKSKLTHIEGIDGFGLPHDGVLSGALDSKSKKISSFELIVADDKNNTIGTYAIDVKQNWSIGSFGLLKGANTLTVKCTFEDGSCVVDSVVINYDKTDKLDVLTIDKQDSDADGLINYLETYYNTDSNKKDTDGDGIDDYTEIAGIHTDPTKQDSDADSIPDGSEDSDNDGLNNLKEIEFGTNPASFDTDLDRLSDGQEIKMSTDPLKEDTDSDGAWDGWEVAHTTDPLQAQKSFVVSATQTGSNNTTTLTVTTEGASVEQVYMLPITGTDIDLTQMPGYICGYEFNAPKNFMSATVEFKLDEKLFKNKDFNPCVYYYNPETQALEEQQTSVNGSTVSFKPSHFSIYLVVDKHSFDQVWNRDIKDPTKQSQASVSYDFCFVLDRSFSMKATDPKWLRKTALINLVDKFREGDRAAIVEYTAKVTKVLNFTGEKSFIKKYIEGITNDSGFEEHSGTNGTAGLQMALDKFSKEARPEARKAIFFLTDGDDNASTQYSYMQLGQMAKEQSIAIYCFVLGDIVSEDKYNMLEQISKATGGKCYRGIDADMSSFTGLIFDETIDYETDSNGDGISDYYAKLIQNGTLTLANGTTPYKGVDFSNPDYDHDGLLNGRELKVCVYYSPDGNRYVYLQQISNPLVKESSHKVDSRTLAIFAALCYEDGSAAERDGRFYRQSEIKGDKENENDETYYFLDGASVFNPDKDAYISKSWIVAEFVNHFTVPNIFANFSATVYVRGNDVVLAYRGTDEDPEWINDLQGGLTNFTFEESYTEVTALCVAYKYAATGKNVYITGHSLGGYLAQVGAAKFLQTSYKNQLKSCEYFNGIGLDYALWARTSTKPLKFNHVYKRNILEYFYGNGGRLISHRIHGDFVSPMGFHSGRTKTYFAVRPCIKNHIAIHGYGNDGAGISMIAAISALNNNNGELINFARQINLYGKGLLWTVHETDSFFYHNLDG